MGRAWVAGEDRPGKPEAVQVIIVVAIADNGVIGAEGRMPWHIPVDLRHVRDLTMDKPLIMGRRTYQAIGRPLPGRTMIVLTRNPSFNEPGVTVVPSWSTALQAGFKAARQTGSGTIVAFGGAEIFVRALPLAVRIHKTEVHMQPAGDVRFPEFDLQHWREVSRDRHPAGAAGIPPACSFVVLDRIGTPQPLPAAITPP